MSFNPYKEKEKEIKEALKEIESDQAILSEDFKSKEGYDKLLQKKVSLLERKGETLEAIRTASNQQNKTIHALILIIIGVSLFFTKALYVEWFPITAIYFGLIFFCGSWYISIRNDWIRRMANYVVIEAMEQQLPIRTTRAERKVSDALFHSEQYTLPAYTGKRIPFMFAVVYTLIYFYLMIPILMNFV